MQEQRQQQQQSQVDEVTVVQQPGGSYVLEVFQGFLAIGGEVCPRLISTSMGSKVAKTKTTPTPFTPFISFIWAFKKSHFPSELDLYFLPSFR